jgi:vacuolar-type H+-ATPase subunit E/Vma4
MDIKSLAKKPTNRDLLNILSEIPEEHLDDNLTIYDAEMDEFYPVESIGEVSNSDVLDNGCLVLVPALTE